MGPPITYILDGKQYVAFAGGQGQTFFPNPGGGAAGGPPGGPAGTPPTPILPKLLVFVLDGKAALPVEPAR